LAIEAIDYTEKWELVVNQRIMQSLETRPLLVDVSHITLRLTHREFEQLCQDNPQMRLELTASGEVIAMVPAGWESSKRNLNLASQIFNWNERTQSGEAFDSSGGFTLPNGAVLSPDVTWIEKSKFANVSAKVAFPAIVPDFVIELRSMTDSLQTLQAKMLEYQANGVRLGWLINPQQQQVEIYRLGQVVEILQSPDTLDGEDVLVDFRLELSAIF
jgi:Uma2 family endonuclease